MPQLDKEQLDKYQNDGYIIIDTGFNAESLDLITSDLEPVWGNQEITSIPVTQANRIQGAWRYSDHVRQLALHPPVIDILEQLYGSKPRPFQTLNFRRGTEQMVHSDSLHFNSEPFGMMCGVWVALEDIGMDQGPLIFYPGSNLWPEMNFPDMNLKEGDFKNYRGYIENLVADRELKPTYGVLKKGQAIIWAANLLHGGLKQNDKNLSRHSQVNHFYFENCRYWRPAFSTGQRHYFNPDWVIEEQPEEQEQRSTGLSSYFKRLFTAKG